MKKLSIIIPIYNGSRRIKKCLKSVFEQTYKNLEVIIIDDGSKDNSYDVACEIVEKNKPEWMQVFVEKQENRGVAAARNKGIDMASGDYVAFIDQDDYIEREYCRNYMEAAETDGWDIVVGGYERVSDKGKELKRVRLCGSRWDPFVVVAPWAHIYRREFLVGNDIKFLAAYIGEDVYFNIIAYSYTEKIGVLKNHSRYKWVNNLESVSNSRQNSVSAENNPLYLLKEIHNRFPENNKIVYDIREYYFLRYIIWYLLFTARGSKRGELTKMADTLYAWLKSEYPDFAKNKHIYHKLQGESAAVYLAVAGMSILHKMKLEKLLLCLLAKK